MNIVTDVNHFEVCRYDELRSILRAAYTDQYEMKHLELVDWYREICSSCPPGGTQGRPTRDELGGETWMTFYNGRLYEATVPTGRFVTRIL